MQVALGITGCIAAYKAIEVMRGLQKAGISVKVILTRAAQQFVAPLTFEALSNQSVITEMFQRDENVSIQHIRIAQESQLLAVAPATANILGKFAHGIADDALSTIYLSTPAPVLLAPAMNVVMWNHPAVKANVELLKERGHYFVNPDAGDLACGMVGEGRLAEVDTIVQHILDVLSVSRDLQGLKILVTAGPTIEDLDPVRFLSNRSSGKMGYAVAAAARARGAEVVLVSGPTNLTPPPGVKVVPVRSAAQMSDAVLERYGASDIVVKAAAVGDYRPAGYSQSKIKKGRSGYSLPLIPTDDILAQLGREKRHQVLVGFAAESEDVESNARLKLERKNLDLVAANDITRGIFGADSATVHVLSRNGNAVTLEDLPKSVIANRILDLAREISSSRKERTAAE